MIHKETIENYPGTLEDLAIEIGDLRYDALAIFLSHLADKIELDGDIDKSRGRVQLAGQLHHCANQLREGKMAIDKAWEICEPYM